MLNEIEKGNQIDVIYTDFSKAFDRISHSIMKLKLEQFGFHSHILNWFGSYLSDRSQYVKINNMQSRTFLTKSGVPQGSHLGPLLFLIYIDDIDCNFKFSSSLTYADDLKLFRVVNNVSESVLLQNDLNKLSSWCQSNTLYLNIEKCIIMSFTRKKQTFEAVYDINNIALCRNYLITDLGIVCDPHLNFNSHIDYIASKSYSMLGFVKRLTKEFTDPYTLKTLYCSYVRSQLEHGSVIWNPCYDVHSRRLERIQKLFVRFALRNLNWTDPWRLPPYVQRCTLINMDLLSTRRMFAAASFVYDILMYKVKSEIILEQLQLNVYSRNSRHRTLINQPFHRSNYGQNEPISHMIRIFNKFNLHFDFNISRDVFLNLIKNV